MRTLVISDLHLGNRPRHDVLRLPVARERLLAALDDVDRLVLLGDVVELMGRQPRRAMGVAEPVLRAIGRRLGRDREVIVVPGNHDAALVHGWAVHQGRDLALAQTVAPDASPALERLLEWLAPARGSVSYPGVWLDERIWATHGHYLDRHLVPQSAFGMIRPGGSDPRRALPIDYERHRPRRRSRRSRESFATRLAHRPVATLLESSAELVRATALPGVPRLLKRGGLAPVTATLIDAQMRHAAVPALARVVRRLGVEAEWVLFGHVHRRGPLDGETWPSDGPTHFLNTGSWLHEPLLVDRARPPHPYWPGGAVLLDGAGPPRSVGLLDDVTGVELGSRDGDPG